MLEFFFQVCGSWVSENFHLNLWFSVVGGFVFESGNFWVRVCGWMVRLFGYWENLGFWGKIVGVWLLGKSGFLGKIWVFGFGEKTDF